MLDILIINSSYPDFKRNILMHANIGIKNGYITYIGHNEPAAETTIDAVGKIVSPGFIDIHMHEEEFLKEGLEYVISNHMMNMGVTTVVAGNCGHLRQPILALKEAINILGGSPVNYLMFAGYNTMRTDLGITSYEKTSKADRDKIRRRMKDELEDGAIGISFGIEYDPAISYEEMLYAVMPFDDPNYLVSMHYREECNINLDPLEEMIRFSRDIPQKFQISHLSSCCSFGTMNASLDAINKAMLTDKGLNYDTYPYDAFSCSIGSAVFDEGCFESWGKGYDSIMLTGDPYKGVFCTKEIFEDARKNYPSMLAVCFVMNEADIKAAITNKNGMIASDGLMRNGFGHPRAAGTFPRVLGKYVREEKALTLIDALRKMTLEPAKRLRLETRGQIAEGMKADITIFDFSTIIDEADYFSIKRPKGIDHVIIDGQFAIKDSLIINQRLGKFISYYDI
nr:amidohydrolase family protein [Clostridia bacterium]